MQDNANTSRTGLAWLSGLLIVLGILGFVPGVTANHQLFHFIQMGTWFNVLYIVAGLVGLAMMSSRAAASGYLRFLSLVFAVWAVIGLIVGSGGQVLGFIENNYWSVLLNAIMAVASLSLSGAFAAAPAGQSRVAFGEYQRGDDDRRR